MTNLAHCPYCSYPVAGEAVTLWDGRAYCRKCVEEVSPELYALASAGSPLCETVQRQDVRAWHVISFLGTRYLLVVLLVFGLPLGLLVLGGAANIGGLVFILLFFGGGGMVFLTLQAFLGALVHRWSLPRTISVENGHFRVVAPKESKSVKITDCKWYLGDPSVDQLAMFTGLRRGVVIQTPEEQFACGHTPEMLEHWQHFLSVTRIPQNRHPGCLWILAVAAAGMIVGALIGSGIGCIVWWIARTPVWVFALGFIGLFEGPMVSLLYATCTWEGFAAARKRLHPGLLGMAFFVIGIKIGLVAGWAGGGWGGVPVCAAINALLGALVGWICRRKIDSAEKEQESAGQFRQ